MGEGIKPLTPVPSADVDGERSCSLLGHRPPERCHSSMEGAGPLGAVHCVEVEELVQ